MSRTLSNTFKAAVFAQQTSEVFIVLLTLSSTELAEDIYVASDPYELLPIAGVRGVVSRGQEYVFLPFNISLPSEDDTGVARAKVSIDNVSREIVQAVRASKGKISIKIEVVLASDVDAPEVSIGDFILDSISYDALTVEGNLSIEYFDLEPYPSKRFTPSDFPAIF